MRTTFNLAFYCRASKCDCSGRAHLELSVSVNAKRRIVTLPYMCTPKDFTARKRDVVKYMDKVRGEVNSYLLDMRVVTADAVVDAIRHGGVRDSTYRLSDLLKEYNQLMEGKDMSLGQYRKYEMTSDLLLSTITDKPLVEVNHGNVLTFFNKVYATYAPNTAAGHIVRAKAYFRYAMSNGKIGIDPIADIRAHREENHDIVILTDEEMELLRNKTFRVERLERVRDLWLFCASSGLSWCDFQSLSREDIQTIDGVTFIKKRRQKTNTEFTAVLLDEGIRILEKYDYHLPTLSNQRMNGYLAEVGDICGIETHFTCHSARHQYATRLLNSGVNIEVVAAAIGHRDSRVTKQYYAKLLDKTILSEIASKVNHTANLK